MLAALCTIDCPNKQLAAELIALLMAIHIANSLHSAPVQSVSLCRSTSTSTAYYGRQQSQPSEPAKDFQQ